MKDNTLPASVPATVDEDAQPAPRPVEPPPDVFVYEEMLARRSRDRKIPKKERTRSLILCVAAGQLREKPLSNLTVDTLLDASGLSRGTFYVYFKDMGDLVMNLLEEFFAIFWANRPKGGAGLGGYEAIYRVNLFYCRSYEANAGLFAAFSRYAESNVDIARIRGRMNSDWTERVVTSIARRRGLGEAERLRLAGTIRILIAMTVESLRDRYVYNDETLTRSFPEAGDMAEAITAIWFRSIFGDEPANGRV